MDTEKFLQAVQKGQIETVKSHIEAGGDVNAKVMTNSLTPSFSTPLFALG